MGQLVWKIRSRHPKASIRVYSEATSHLLLKFIPSMHHALEYMREGTVLRQVTARLRLLALSTVNLRGIQIHVEEVVLWLNKKVLPMEDVHVSIKPYSVQSISAGAFIEAGQGK